MQEISFTFADPDYYLPLEAAADVGASYRPSAMPPDWAEVTEGMWRFWRPAGHTTPRQGWKVHVSARPDRLSPVLDVVARACADHGVPFKHLSARLHFLLLNHKHAARPQSGKFCALYPADEAAARAIMERLRADLSDEDGPYILSDRRYRDSRTVHYRYGSFARQLVRQPDGTGLPVVLGPDGEPVEDRRHVSFVLPPTVTDPFLEDTAEETPSTSFHGITFQAALQHSNAGGAYRARHEATGRTVLVKEARGHTGVDWGGRCAPERLRREWRTLRELHEACPGVAPEPVEYFTEWEHEFLVMEFVEGTPLKNWMVAHNTLIRSAPTRAEMAQYHDKCVRIMTALEKLFAVLHEHGYVFVDVSPTNVLVTDDLGVRLVDFEAAHRLDTDDLRPMGTEGFTPPPALVGDDPVVYDEYGLAAIAQFLMAPMAQVIERHPDALSHLRHELDELGDVPEALWSAATRFHRPSPAGNGCPAPGEVAADPLRHLRELRAKVATGLAAMARPDDPQWTYPTVPKGFGTNPACVAFGTAGVVHALRAADEPVPAAAVDRLRTQAREGEFAPGLMYGGSGIAWVLADLGHLDDARRLLDAADRHPITGSCHTYGSGSAGVAMAHLAMFGHTGDRHHLDRAEAITLALPDDLTPGLGKDNATGLLEGRCGIALMLQQLAAVTGDDRLLDRAVRLLHEELDRASAPDAPDLAFPVSDRDSRSMPYVHCGSAGMLLVTTRCLAARDDERLQDAQERLRLRLGGPFTVMAGLYQGITGLGFALAEHARLTGDTTSAGMATRTGTALFKYAVPWEHGVRFLGEGRSRYSADLWSGSAGVLLFLHTLLEPGQDPLFTVDRLGGRQRHERTLPGTTG
ncbi:class III lanthionine synthetase LanKC [Actinophytocola sp. NPDC049390]|uniref:class III lanthionine synthetase LanKC n=1 Tax=Actinophytocola sp. NPDC049390 TaxID=3363894 RepID=UPI0037B3CA69